MQKDAVSPIVSIILLIAIVLVVVSGMLLWATPIIQRLQGEAEYTSAVNSLKVICDTLDDSVKGGEDTTRSTSFSLSGGNFYWAKDDERWIISYGLNKNMRIRFFDLDDGDERFGINSTKEIKVNITTYWPVGYDYSENYTWNNKTINKSRREFTASKMLKNIVYIRVNKSYNTEKLAELWLFDLSSLTYKSTRGGVHWAKLVNNGLVSGSGNALSLSRGSYWLEKKEKKKNNVVHLHMVQMNYTGITSGGAGRYKATITVNGSWLRFSGGAEEEVYNLAVKIHDEWNDTWYKGLAFTTGFKEKRFKEKNVGLIYEEKSVKLKLIHHSIWVKVSTG